MQFKKLKYQDDAVTTARRILEEYGGVFLSDVVGLGKTYMAALLAQQLSGRNLVIAPPIRQSWKCRWATSKGMMHVLSSKKEEPKANPFGACIEMRCS